MDNYKTVVEINLEFTGIYFQKNAILYDLRKSGKVLLQPTRSVRYGINLFLFRGSLVWNNLSLLRQK